MIPGTTVVSQAEGSDAEHFLVEANIRGPLQRRVARLVGVERIGTDEMGRRGHGGDVRILRGGSSMTLKLRLGPVSNLAREKRGFGS
jgi:hypothetical protein